MAAKVHKTLRLDEGLVNRITSLGKEGEAFSNTVNRVLAVGCDTLENVTRSVDLEHAEMMAEHRAEHDENTQKIIDLLEKENARLAADHEADRKAMAEKDKQLAAALEKAHELADQAHVLLGMTQESKNLPSSDEGGEVLDITPSRKVMTFGEWFKQRFGN